MKTCCCSELGFGILLFAWWQSVSDFSVSLRSSNVVGPPPTGQVRKGSEVLRSADKGGSQTI